MIFKRKPEICDANQMTSYPAKLSYENWVHQGNKIPLRSEPVKLDLCKSINVMKIYYIKEFSRLHVYANNNRPLVGP